MPDLSRKVAFFDEVMMKRAPTRFSFIWRAHATVLELK